MSVFGFQELWLDSADEGDRLDESSSVAWCRVYRHQIDEAAKSLKLWVRRKRGNRSWCAPAVGAS